MFKVRDIGNTKVGFKNLQIFFASWAHRGSKYDVMQTACISLHYSSTEIITKKTFYLIYMTKF